MNVLEKILEEIDALENKEYVSGKYHEYFIDGANCAITDVREIIRRCMNDGKDIDVPSNNGWIPCNERLPEEKEFQRAYCRNHYAAEFIVMIENATRPTTLYFKDGSWFDEERNYYKVLAWMPLPEPYKPKETTVTGMEHIMSRFTEVK